MHLPEGTLLKYGWYKINRFIKSGGFGCTYEGVQTLMGERVAIKEYFVGDFCNRESDHTVSVGTKSREADFLKFKQRFIKEATLLFKLQHPNIVRVTDVFEENGTAYYVMDYVDGQSLAERSPKGKQLSEQEALGYIHQICEALKYVHSQNILHLDIKPQNIMVTNNGKAILIDFGASKYYDEETGEQTSTLLGIHTKPYAPLEQLDGDFRTFNPAVDIYALGATLYRLLTGIVPLTALDRLKRKVLSPLPSNISQPTRDAIEAAMQIDSEDRPQSIEQFESILNQAIPGGEEEKTFLDPKHKEVSSENIIRGDLGKVKKEVRNAKPVEDKNINTPSLEPQPSQKTNQEKKENPTKATGSIDGHEYVDLGLPSGLLWATCNVGASRPEEYGDYFAWGETKPKANYTDLNSVTYGRGNWIQKKLKGQNYWLVSQNYIDSTGNLTRNHDAANHNWGGSWRMPTDKEIEELVNNTKTLRITLNGVNGLLVTSKSNGNGIFLPTAGYRAGFSLNRAGEDGAFWSSKPHESDSESASLLSFLSGSFKSGSWYRYYGLTVRPVSECVYNNVIFHEDDEEEITDPPFLDEEEIKGPGIFEDEISEPKISPINLPNTINGHEYVDLGLPSGLKWATCNVGANKPEEYGDYFAWGETKTKPSFDKNNSATYEKDKQWLRSNGSIDDNGNLTMSHDAARQNWGSTWRMPNMEEIIELINHTTTEWITRNGVKGRLVKSKKNGNSIFLPAAGWRLGSSSGYVGEYGYFWSSSPNESDSEGVFYLYFGSGYFLANWYYRDYGFSVRPVSE